MSRVDILEARVRVNAIHGSGSGSALRDVDIYARHRG